MVRVAVLGAALFAAALLLVVVPTAVRSVGPAPAPDGTGALATVLSRGESLPTPFGAGPLASGPRNAPVDNPCNTTGATQPQEVYDNRTGNLYVAFIGCDGIGFARSVDGGYSFQPAFRVPGSLPANGSAWDPQIALAPNGTVYVSYILGYLDGFPNAAPVVAWSWDDGLSFAGYQTVAPPALSVFQDRDSLAVAPNGTVFVSWDYSPVASLDVLDCPDTESCEFQSGDYNIVLAWSADGGRSWSSSVQVTPGYPDGGATTAEIRVAANGTIDLLYQKFDVTGAKEILGLGREYFRSSPDGGRSWSAPLLIANLTFTNQTWWVDGSFALNATGTLYVAFDAQSSGADTALLVASTDGGTLWSAPVRLNPDVDGADHMDVAVVGTANDTAYVAWMTNSSSLGWAAWEATVTSGATVVSGVQPISDQYGDEVDWVGNAMGLAWLGAAEVSVSFAIGVSVPQLANPVPQVFESVVGAVAPGAPTILSATPGRGVATLAWSPPTSGGPVTGYLAAWSIEGLPGYNATEPVGARSATVGPLFASAHYRFQVAAYNGGGPGPYSGVLNLTLTAWAAIAGTVTPASALVEVDSVPVSVVNGAYYDNTTYSPHAVSASAPDYSTSYGIVVPSWNGTVYQNFTLTLLPGTVDGFVYPVTSAVDWDGSPIPVQGNGSFTAGGAAGSTHFLTVAFPGFVPVNDSVTIVANRTVWNNVTLQPEPATLRVAVDPANATLLVNHSVVPLDATGNGSVSLHPGTYPIEVSRTNYDTYFANVTLLPGGERNVSVALTYVGPTGGGGSGGSSPGGGGGLLGSPYLPLLAVLVVVVIAVVVVLAMRRRRPPEFEGPEAPAEMPSFAPLDGSPEALPPGDEPSEPPTSA